MPRSGCRRWRWRCSRGTPSALRSGPRSAARSWSGGGWTRFWRPCARWRGCARRCAITQGAWSATGSGGLLGIPRMGAVRGLGVGGGGLQDGDRDAAGAGRDALDGGGGKCDRQPALLQAERPLRAVLGGAGRANFMVTGKQRGAGSGEAAALEVRRDELRRQLAVIGDLRPESLGSRCLRPGNPNCRCWRQGELGHGPYWYLTCKMRAGR